MALTGAHQRYYQAPIANSSRFSRGRSMSAANTASDCDRASGLDRERDTRSLRPSVAKLKQLTRQYKGIALREIIETSRNRTSEESARFYLSS